VAHRSFCTNAECTTTILQYKCEGHLTSETRDRAWARMAACELTVCSVFAQLLTGRQVFPLDCMTGTGTWDLHACFGVFLLGFSAILLMSGRLPIQELLKQMGPVLLLCM
jgi:hypothetical protein